LGLHTLDKQQAIRKMNTYGEQSIPFVFVIDFEMQKIIVEASSYAIPLSYHVKGQTNVSSSYHLKDRFDFDIKPISFDRYANAFNKVKEEINFGNSFLLNLTFPTPINTSLSLSEIYKASTAPYKLYIPNQCVVFSPESFVSIQNGIISSYPMKGTIDASFPNAEAIILADQKETAEHCTIVDLIRNDLSMVAKKVSVEKFRYINTIETNRKTLLQVSSKISGIMPSDYKQNIGTHLFTLLPAGSISGAPKKKTVEIIENVEQQARGYYTGIMGYFDGNNLESGVMIRFIEKVEDQLYFRSGGGITSQSELQSEYQELIDKVYVPILRNDKNQKRKSLQHSISSS